MDLVPGENNIAVSSVFGMFHVGLFIIGDNNLHFDPISSSMAVFEGRLMLLLSEVCQGEMEYGHKGDSAE